MATLKDIAGGLQKFFTGAQQSLHGVGQTVRNQFGGGAYVSPQEYAQKYTPPVTQNPLIQKIGTDVKKAAIGVAKLTPPALAYQGIKTYMSPNPQQQAMTNFKNNVQSGLDVLNVAQGPLGYAAWNFGVPGAKGMLQAGRTGQPLAKGFEQGVLTNPTLGEAAGQTGAKAMALNTFEFGAPFLHGTVSNGLAKLRTPGIINKVLAEGKALGFDGLSPRAFQIHPEDQKVLTDIIGKMQAGLKNTPQELRTLDLLAAHYLGKRYQVGSTQKLLKTFDWVLAKKNAGIPIGNLPKPAYLYGGRQAADYPAGGMGTFSSMADKKPRFEIDDSGARIKLPLNYKNEPSLTFINNEKLTDILDHPELFKQYPELRSVKVKTAIGGGEQSKTSAYYDPIEKSIGINPNGFQKKVFDLATERGHTEIKIEDLKSTLLHEIQHAIQEKEGFARGGSPESTKFPPDVQAKINKISEKMQSLMRQGKDPSMYNDELSKAYKEGQFTSYQRLSGEVEARDVQSRMNLTPGQRATTLPYQSQGIPVKDQIVQFKSGKSSMVDSGQFKAPYTRGDISKLETQLDELLGTHSFMNEKWTSKLPARQTAFNQLESAAQSGDEEAKFLLEQARGLEMQLARAQNVKNGIVIPEGKALRQARPGSFTNVSESKKAYEIPEAQGKQLQTGEPQTKVLLRPQTVLGKTPQSLSSEPIISPNVYNAESTPKMQEKIRSKQEDRDFKEWSQMIFKQEGATVKNKDKALIDTIGKNIEEKTNASAARELANAQSSAKKEFVTNQKGKVVLSKGGSPIDRDVVVKAQGWKDKPRVSYARETMTRNFEDIMGKDAPEMKARYLEPVQKAEANRIRWLNKERAEIKSLGIAPRSQESKLVQQLGEGLITPDQVRKQSQNADKIIHAESVLRKKYDAYLTDINEVLQRNGYDPIPKRKDYFRHFTEVQGTLEQFGIPVRDSALPTDINGLSSDFRPGKNFFSSALQRKGNITDYDAIQGIDKYIDGASKQMFHTDNIQNLRLLDKSLRETYAGTQHLTNFVADLTEYTNTLAGKKAMIDRSVESALGRGIYAATDKLRRQAGANMVGANVASAMTNYIPLTQSLATTDKPSFVKGMMQTIASTFKDDGFTNRSDFLSRRIGSDPLATTLWSKIGDKSMWLMRAIDNFTSGTIVRSKYAEGVKKGLSPDQAMKQADEWAAKLMADRSLGSMPTLFNSKTLGLLTQFQLEVNNQMSFMFKDIPRNYNAIGAASALGQVFLYSYLFNSLYEKALGRRPAFDPIGVAQQTYEDYTNPEMKKGQATKNLVGNVSDQLPFTGILTGGRIPIGSAIPNPIAVATGDSTISKEAKKLFYLLPPAGGGQLKKTIEGAGAYKQGGSVSDSGRVRYPIPPTTTNAIRTAIGGQYATPEARAYFREGRSTLGDKQSEVFKQTNNKTEFYQKIMDQRKEKSHEETIKETMKSSRQTTQTNGKKVYILQADGDIKTIDTSFQPRLPALTGNKELDKKLKSKFGGEITRKANDIVTLYENGNITVAEAEQQLQALKELKNKYTPVKAKKPKKISIRKVPRSKLIKISASRSSKLGTIKIKRPPAPKIKTGTKSKAITIKPIKTKKLRGLTYGTRIV